MRTRELVRLLRVGELRIVGSTLRRDEPRDLDVLLVLTDALFAELWMPARRWSTEGASGRWTRPRWQWARDTLRLAEVMRRRVRSRRPLDFQIVPQSSVRCADA